jgi:replicative DNA helicase
VIKNLSKAKTSRYDPSVDVEFAVVSALLLNPDLLKEAGANGLAPEDFETREFGELFARMRNLWIAGSSWSESESARSIQGSGVDRRMLARMLEMGAVYAHDLKYFIKRVMETSRMYRLASAIEQAAETITTKHEGVLTEAIRLLEAEIEQLKADRSMKLYDCHQLGIMSEQAKRKVNVTKAETGLFDVDAFVGGLHAGDLSILAARSSVGKTAFALQVAYHNARRNRPVLFVSLEMSAVDIYDRLVASDTGISIAKLRIGRDGMTDEEFREYLDSSEYLKDLPLTVHAPTAATVADIRTAAKVTKAKAGGLGLVVVDYLTFIKSSNTRMDRREQVGEICKQLKQVANDLEVPMMVLSQLNRQAEGEIPTLSMLRESGSVEEDADQVIFVHRQSRSDRDGKIIVAKNRHGQCGIVDVDWDGTRMRYSTGQDAVGIASTGTNWEG